MTDVMKSEIKVEPTSDAVLAAMILCPTTLSAATFDHTLDPKKMNAIQVYAESLYLSMGFTEEKDERRGVKLGLSQALAERREELRNFLLVAVFAYLEQEAEERRLAEEAEARMEKGRRILGL